MYAKSFLALDGNGRLTGARTAHRHSHLTTLPVPGRLLPVCRLAQRNIYYVRKIFSRT